MALSPLLLLVVVFFCAVVAMLAAAPSRAAGATATSIAFYKSLDSVMLPDDAATQALYAAYLTKYGKSYPSAEFQKHYTIFRHHAARVKHHEANATAAGVYYQIELNKMSDMTAAQRNQRFGIPPGPMTPIPGANIASHKSKERMAAARSTKIITTNTTTTNTTTTNATALVDWRQRGIINPARDQGQCGSCWAFAAAGLVESTFALDTNFLTQTSEQQYLDCGELTFGCEGGWPSHAIQDIINNYNGAIMSLAGYPYVGAKQSTCHINQQFSVMVVKSYDAVYGDANPALLQQYVSMGPAVTGIQARNSGLLAYKAGVFEFPGCSNSLYSIDHVVLVVGYGISVTTVQSAPSKSTRRAAAAPATVTVTEPYWIIRNSWGTQWGNMSGFGYVLRGVNMCSCEMFFMRSSSNEDLEFTKWEQDDEDEIGETTSSSVASGDSASSTSGTSGGSSTSGSSGNGNGPTLMLAVGLPLMAVGAAVVLAVAVSALVVAVRTNRRLAAAQLQSTFAAEADNLAL